MPVRKKVKLFKPAVGHHAAWFDEDSQRWSDVMVHKVREPFSYVTLLNEEDAQRFRVESDTLEYPMNPDVNQRFEQYKRLTGLVFNKKLNSLFVSGEGGVGKDYVVNQMIESEELEEGKDYVRLKGHVSPLALFNVLQANSEKTLIFSDCDSAFENATSANILKAVLDTYDKRTVSWLNRKDISNSFTFTGSAIFLSNKPKEKVDNAIISRSIFIDLMMTPQEKIDRMRHILPAIDAVPDMRFKDKERVLDLIDKYKMTVNNLNIRTLIKGLLIYGSTQDLDLVKYQVINS